MWRFQTHVCLFLRNLNGKSYLALTQLTLHLVWKPQTRDSIEINKNTRHTETRSLQGINELQEWNKCVTFLLHSLFYFTWMWWRGPRLRVELGLSLNLPLVCPESAPVPNKKRKACPETWPTTTPWQQSCQPMSQCTKTWMPPNCSVL